MVTPPALAEHVKGKGRHYRNPKSGDLVPSVTNVIGMLDKPALPRWAASEVAKRAADLKRSLANMSDADVVDTLKGAPWSRSKRAADRGTDIHGYLEARLRGWEPDELSDDAAPYRDAAEAWLDDTGVEVVETELTVFHPLYAGTGDLWGVIDGQRYIIDFKTSKGIYDEAALQLAALLGTFTTDDGGPAPHLDGHDWQLMVVRIGQDKFEAKAVADAAGSLDAFHALLTVWHWKHGKAYA